MEALPNEFKNLLSPFKLGGITLKNRFVFLAHFTAHGHAFGYGENGLASERLANHYIERAKGGTALVCVTQSVSPGGQMDRRMVHAHDKRNKQVFTEMIAAIHEYDCKVFGQFNHGGHTTLMTPPPLLYAPSQMPEPNCYFNTKEIEKEEMEAIKDYYVRAAVLEKEWGFDGVELKIAHDGLLRTFVSPYFNRRTDEYGGSYENRMRYPLEIIHAIRKEVGPDYPIGIRLCLDEFTDWGFGLDYGIQLAKTLEENGITYINTDSGTFSSYYMEIPNQYIPLGFGIYLAAEMKKVVNIPVVAFGRINDPVMAENILAKKHADLIGMCRQLICDPETPKKTLHGRTDNIRHCIGCMEGCMASLYSDGVLCIQNPGAGREKIFGIGTVTNVKKPKNVMVVGAGVSGLKAAEICGKRGHKVTVYEKSDSIGGQLRIAEKIPYKSEFEEVYRHLKIELSDLKIPIYLNTEIDIFLVEKDCPDVIIIATGSYPFVREFTGQQGAKMNIIDSRRAIIHSDEVGENVLFFDDIGYWQGAGVADYVSLLCKELTIVTPKMTLGKDIEDTSVFMIHKRLYRFGAEIIPSHVVSKIDGSNIIIENVFNHQKTVVEDVDTLIVAESARSDNALYKQLKMAGKNVIGIGDCIAPRTVRHCILNAEEVARSI
jgi:2,4-dienoyl-CoA reductase-like NADH-dependent reductase (Old Yellow Enzyme family)/thioredoxin reductase